MLKRVFKLGRCLFRDTSIVVFAVIFGILFTLTSSPIWGQDEPILNEVDFVPGEVLVKFKPEVTAEQKRILRKTVEAKLLTVINQLSVEHWRVPPEKLPSVLALLNADAIVVYAEPNYLLKPAAVPNDSHYNLLWHLSNTGQTVSGRDGTAGADIDAESAWNITTGSKDVVIAVIDSGVAIDHPDLKNNIWTNADEIADDGIDNDNNGYIDDVHGWDFINGRYGDNDPTDVSTGTLSAGHGTHVAGTIAAQGDNGLGVTGVMWKAQIMPLLLFDLYQDDAPYAGAIQVVKVGQAILYAVENGANIINLSLTVGSGADSQFVYDAIKNADMSNILVVVAAGNEANNNDVNPAYPSSFDLPNIISVAATDENDKLSSFSNYGLQSVDVAAPGGDHPNGIADNLYSTTPPKREVLFSEDFESGGGQWGGNSIHEAWTLDPDPFLSTWAQDSTGNYANDEDSYIQTRNGIDTSNCRGLHLQFDIEFQLEDNFDFLYVEGSQDNINYVELFKFTGIGSEKRNIWTNQLTYDEVYLRFRLKTDESNTDDGVSIDNIKLTGIPWNYTGNEYDFKVGTSMAAPVVSGIAGLLWSYDPSLTHYEVKEAIEKSVDKLEALNGKVATGGRVNAYKALQYVGAESNPDPDPDPDPSPNPDPSPEPDIIQVAGTWQVTDENDERNCEEAAIRTVVYNLDVTQNGDRVTVSKEPEGTFQGTINGNTIQWTGNYPEQGGITTILSMTVTVNTSGDRFTSESVWSWSDGFSSCSGTSRGTGTRLSSGSDRDTAGGGGGGGGGGCLITTAMD
ncbi:MAG: S8 family serine peptidase [Desulfosarcinaceae bacterium]|nr:S8 family serine peptidase [Desulfosarcinaceae bacterium]